MKKIKKLLDPNNILNQKKIFQKILMMVYVFDKMKDERKKMILSEADKFIKLNTNQIICIFQ